MSPARIGGLNRREQARMMHRRLRAGAAGRSAGSRARTAFRASTVSLADVNRWAGFFSISRSTTSASMSGTAGFASWTGRGRLSVTCRRTTNADVPWNGGTPASIA